VCGGGGGRTERLKPPGGGGGRGGGGGGGRPPRPTLYYDLVLGVVNAVGHICRVGQGTHSSGFLLVHPTAPVLLCHAQP
jgi:hypothetical protein